LLIADPGVPAMIAERLSDSLPNELTDWAPADGKWDVSVRRHSYPFDEHAEVLEVIRTIDPAGETEDARPPAVSRLANPSRMGAEACSSIGFRRAR
jgi:hypothetical protein